MRKWISVPIATTLVALCTMGLPATVLLRDGASLLDADLGPSVRTGAQWRQLYWRSLGSKDPVPEAFRMEALSGPIGTSDPTLGAQRALSANVARLLMPERAGRASSFRRHLAEALLRLRIVRQWTPTQALDATLAHAYFGRGARGLDEAALAYFGRPGASLEQGQVLALLVVMRGPARYEPQCKWTRFQARYLELARRTAVSTRPAVALHDLVPDRTMACTRPVPTSTGASGIP